ncbi:MAG: sigma-70 family RNA polymerase sigma factor [Bdellovibrionales bacterium]|nr:sigma-70 family RNA polymerase sigma factor [Bdellovibrionales bacterium]
MNGLKDRSDEELMTLYQGGDYAAFECLYERHSGRVFQYLKGKVSAEAAKDLLQETFLKIHRSRSQYQPQYPFLPWLFTVARNSLNDFFKSPDQKVIKIGIDTDSLPAALPHIGSEHDLSAALSGLPHVQRRAIELRYLNEWSFEKIADEMSTTPENSRQIISRGIKKMRSLLRGGKK